MGSRLLSWQRLAALCPLLGLATWFGPCSRRDGVRFMADPWELLVSDVFSSFL
jgi:hypothetical protein